MEERKKEDKNKGGKVAQCCLCSSTDIKYSNAACSNKVEGLEVPIDLCTKHAQIAKHPNRWPLTNRDLWTDAAEELLKQESLTKTKIGV